MLYMPGGLCGQLSKKFYPVTGLWGIYIEYDTGLNYT